MSQWGPDVAGTLGNLDYRVAHGPNWAGPGTATEKRAPPAFFLVRDAGTGEADGVYKPANRRWLDHDVYENRYGDCIISREAHTNSKNGEVKHGFVLGRDGRPLYGVKTEKHEVPASGWKQFQGQEPVPEILRFATWSDACQHGAWYFAQEAENAAKGGHWKVVLMMADRAFDCHTTARPKGRGDMRDGGSEWSLQLCQLLGTRAEALLHLQEYKRALVDACAAVHFVPAFEWSKARIRGITACLNLGVSEIQAKLLMDEMCKRNDREFPGVQALEPLVDVFLERAKSEQLKPVKVEDETEDDGRLYFSVVDPEDCKLYSTPSWTGKVIGKRQYNDVVRGGSLLKGGTWLELHVSEEFDDSSGHRRAYVPVFTEGPEDEREEVLEKLPPKEYPRPGRWEELRLKLRPVGLKPPSEMHATLDYGRWQDPEPPENMKVWPYVYKHGLAVSCMLRGASENVIDSFVRFHWVTGWNHVFLFFDDPDDPGIRHAKALEDYSRSKNMAGAGLSVHRMDAEWWDRAKSKSRYYLRREKNDMYEGVCKKQDAHGDLDSRKVIVMDQAILEAHEMGIDWFVHLDIDECVYVPRMQECSSRRFFGSKERNIEAVRLWNHEAIPEETECQDWFRDCTLFQLNRFHCRGFKPPREYDQMLRQREGRELEPEKQSGDTGWWHRLMGQIFLRRQAPMQRLRAALPALGPLLRRALGASVLGPESPSLDGLEIPAGTGDLVETFFSFSSHDCGKMVVRLDRHLRPPFPCSLHSYMADNGDLLKQIYQASKADDAVILHYPNASMSSWRRKYEALGDLGLREPDPATKRIHAASSLLVRKGARRDQDLFYKTFIMQNEYNEVAYLAEHGLVTRVEGVANILYYYDNPQEAPEQLPGHMQWVDPQSGLKLGR
ncbi:unnamed protein product [Polarella glacialis]|uniref:Glycosyltransferase family 92 protein n=2 Tax=Polarella glacialis TaxID=89957 RepID=A0A813EPC2_POLGL|nr:unnamed protein product [Polarella glacialis]